MNTSIYLTILFLAIITSLVTIIIGTLYSIKQEKFTTSSSTSSNINPVVPTKTLVYITDTSVNNNVNNCAACSIFDSTWASIEGTVTAQPIMNNFTTKKYDINRNSTIPNNDWRTGANYIDENQIKSLPAIILVIPDTTNNKNIVKKFGNMGRDSIRILDWAKSF
jgi:hypothetical protein